MVKRVGSYDTIFTTRSTGGTTGYYFRSSSNCTTCFASLDPTGFTARTTNNANGDRYIYFAFKNTPGLFQEGTYIGDGTDNRNISGFTTGYKPSFVFIKNTNSGTSSDRDVRFSNRHHYTDVSGLFVNSTANTWNTIQQLQDGGFQIGSSTWVNRSGNTMVFVALGGESDIIFTPKSPDIYTTTYIGNGSSQTLNVGDRAPGFVLIKSESNQYPIVKTWNMEETASVSLAYIIKTTIAAGINRIEDYGNSISLGNDAGVNGSGLRYNLFAINDFWSNEFGFTDMQTNIAIGSYTGSGGVGDMTIDNLPFQPSAVLIFRNGGVGIEAVYTSDMPVGSSVGLSNTSYLTNSIKSIGDRSFTIGKDGGVNSNGVLYTYIIFAETEGFHIGSYIGDGIDNRKVYGLGMRPDVLWVLNGGANDKIMWTETYSNALIFRNVAPVNNRIKQIFAGAMKIGSDVEVNTNGTQYFYLAWRDKEGGNLSVEFVSSNDETVTIPSNTFSATNITNECVTTSVSIGDSSEFLRVENDSLASSWSLSISAFNGISSIWSNGGTGSYDYNDINGCTDGTDSDGVGGQMAFVSAPLSITPASLCSNNGISIPTDSSFAEGITDSLTIATSSSSTPRGCYWDIRNIQLEQKIPAFTEGGVYGLELSFSLIAV